MPELQFGALLDGCPWRDVVFTERCTGRRGASRWRLLLSCGHRVLRRRAVHRVKCLLCGDKDRS